MLTGKNMVKVLQGKRPSPNSIGINPCRDFYLSFVFRGRRGVLVDTRVLKGCVIQENSVSRKTYSIYNISYISMIMDFMKRNLH
jgi:hypothetical protein